MRYLAFIWILLLPLTAFTEEAAKSDSAPAEQTQAAETQSTPASAAKSDEEKKPEEKKPAETTSDKTDKPAATAASQPTPATPAGAAASTGNASSPVGSTPAAAAQHAGGNPVGTPANAAQKAGAVGGVGKPNPPEPTIIIIPDVPVRIDPVTISTSTSVSIPSASPTPPSSGTAHPDFRPLPPQPVPPRENNTVTIPGDRGSIVQYEPRSTLSVFGGSGGVYDAKSFSLEWFLPSHGSNPGLGLGLSTLFTATDYPEGLNHYPPPHDNYTPAGEFRGTTYSLYGIGALRLTGNIYLRALLGFGLHKITKVAQSNDTGWYYEYQPKHESTMLMGVGIGLLPGLSVNYDNLRGTSVGMSFAF